MKKASAISGVHEQTPFTVYEDPPSPSPPPPPSSIHRPRNPTALRELPLQGVLNRAPHRHPERPHRIQRTTRVQRPTGVQRTTRRQQPTRRQPPTREQTQLLSNFVDYLAENNGTVPPTIFQWSIFRNSTIFSTLNANMAETRREQRQGAEEVRMGMEGGVQTNRAGSGSGMGHRTGGNAGTGSKTFSIGDVEKLR